LAVKFIISSLDDAKSNIHTDVYLNEIREYLYTCSGIRLDTFARCPGYIADSAIFSLSAESKLSIQNKMQQHD